MSIVVFWLEHAPASKVVTRHASFSDLELKEALSYCEKLRKKSTLVSHVTICSEPSDMVGKTGVDAVIDGKTPDGQAYDWTKTGRAGKFKAADMTKQHVKADEQR